VPGILIPQTLLHDSVLVHRITRFRRGEIEKRGRFVSLTGDIFLAAVRPEMPDWKMEKRTVATLARASPCNPPGRMRLSEA